MRKKHPDKPVKCKHCKNPQNGKLGAICEVCSKEDALIWNWMPRVKEVEE